MSTVSIIDYGMGNLDSVARAVQECGDSARFAATPGELQGAQALILPGVGSFRDGMEELTARGLDEAIRGLTNDTGLPLLGICLGMQLLATTGREGGAASGLGLVPGEVVRFEPDSPATRIPHVGWNEVYPTGESPLFTGIEPGKDFYFVHSYHFRCADPADVVASTPYCGGFTSCVRRSNVWGVQFHPEKSQKPGLRLLANFLDLCR